MSFFEPRIRCLQGLLELSSGAKKGHGRSPVDSARDGTDDSSDATGDKVNTNRVASTSAMSSARDPGRSSHSPEENDTFLLAKDSLLFSQISKNEVIVADPVPRECHIVEVKEHEVPRSEHFVVLERGVEYNPLSVEIVEIIEMESEPEIMECIDEEEGEYELEKGHPSSPRKRPILENADDVAKKTCLKPKFDGRKSTSLEESGGPKFTGDGKFSPAVTEEPKFENDGKSILLEMTDRINRTEEATVKTCDEFGVYDLVGKPATSPCEGALKELKLKKEIQMSRTYQIRGSFQKTETLTATGTGDDGGCLCGSNMETEDATTFSGDEGSSSRKDDSSSSCGDFSVCETPLDSNSIEVGFLHVVVHGP